MHCSHLGSASTPVYPLFYYVLLKPIVWFFLWAFTCLVQSPVRTVTRTAIQTNISSALDCPPTLYAAVRRQASELFRHEGGFITLIMSLKLSGENTQKAQHSVRWILCVISVARHTGLLCQARHTRGQAVTLYSWWTDRPKALDSGSRAQESFARSSAAKHPSVGHNGAELQTVGELQLLQI